MSINDERCRCGEDSHACAPWAYMGPWHDEGCWLSGPATPAEQLLSVDQTEQPALPHQLDLRITALRKRGLSDRLASMLIEAASPGLLAEVERLSDRAIGLVSTAANREETTR